jgi:hypothetical protein
VTLSRREFIAQPIMLGIAATAAAQQKQSRLLVTNKTKTSVEVFVDLRKTWQSRGRISPGASLPVYNVTNGQRFRAVWGSASKLHTVTLRFDRTYGGWQDTLDVP